MVGTIEASVVPTGLNYPIGDLSQHFVPGYNQKPLWGKSNGNYRREIPADCVTDPFSPHFEIWFADIRGPRILCPLDFRNT